MRQVRAVKVIEKGEEILATYHNEPFGSRDTRQKTLLKRRRSQESQKN